MKKTKQVRSEGLDKFYTLPIYSKKCIDKVFDFYSPSEFDLIIEPSAGNGSFLKQLPPHTLGLDILPEHPDIQQQDFLLYSPEEDVKNILVIGNPPFGRNSSLAIKFFNHAAEWCNIIAFIIPRTFRKVSIQNKLNPYFHLRYDEELPINPCCFSPKMMVKCCFQIWERKNTKREKIKLPTTHPDWKFLAMGPKDEFNQPTPPEDADFAIRAYGGKIGSIQVTNLSELRPKSWHWIQSNIPIHILIERFKQLDYSNSVNTARQNSMGRAELVQLYNGINSIQ